jgi:hypothetical protein
MSAPVSYRLSQLGWYPRYQYYSMTSGAITCAINYVIVFARADTLDLPSLRGRLNEESLREAHRRALALSYDQYRSTVLEFLDPSERAGLASASAWDEQRLFAARLIEAIQGEARK